MSDCGPNRNGPYDAVPAATPAPAADSHRSEIRTAFWKPGWHCNDQSLQLGQAGEFWFYADPQTPEDSGSMAQRPPLQLFNRTVSDDHVPQLRSATVVGIEHPVLGPLAGIDTSELDYVFRTVGGDDYVVNAEEEPGMVYDMEQVQVKDWTITVTLLDVSGPAGEIV